MVIPSFNIASLGVLSKLTAQFELIVYNTFFVVAIRLRFEKEKTCMVFTSRAVIVGEYLVSYSGIGIFSCSIAILIGLISSEGVEVGNLKIYETILISDLIILSIPPFTIYKLQTTNYDDENRWLYSLRLLLPCQNNQKNSQSKCCPLPGHYWHGSNKKTGDCADEKGNAGAKDKSTFVFFFQWW